MGLLKQFDKCQFLSTSLKSGPCLSYELLQLPHSDDGHPETPALAGRPAEQTRGRGHAHEAGAPLPPKELGDADECASPAKLPVRMYIHN